MDPNGKENKKKHNFFLIENVSSEVCACRQMNQIIRRRRKVELKYSAS